MIDDENDIDDDTDFCKLDALLEEYERVHKILVPNETSRLQIVCGFNPDFVKVVWVEGKGRKAKHGTLWGWHHIAAMCKVIQDETGITKQLLKERGTAY